MELLLLLPRPRRVPNRQRPLQACPFQLPCPREALHLPWCLPKSLLPRYLRLRPP